jgi:hypothetical protein
MWEAYGAVATDRFGQLFFRPFLNRDVVEIRLLLFAILVENASKFSNISVDQVDAML